MDRSAQTKAMLIGGFVGGLIAAVPGLGVLGNCCCGGVWTGLAAAIAVSYLASRSAYLYDADALGAGIGAGLIAGLCFALSTVAQQLLMSPQNLRQAMDLYQKFLPPEWYGLMQPGFQNMAQGPRAIDLIAVVIFILIHSLAVGAGVGFVTGRIARSRRRPPAAWPQSPGYYPGPGPGPAGQWGKPGAFGPPPSIPYPPPGPGYGYPPPPPGPPAGYPYPPPYPPYPGPPAAAPGWPGPQVSARPPAFYPPPSPPAAAPPPFSAPIPWGPSPLAKPPAPPTARKDAAPSGLEAAKDEAGGVPGKPSGDDQGPDR